MQSPAHSRPVSTLGECAPREQASALVMVRLKLPATTTRDDIRNVAGHVRERFIGMPGLQRKYFAYSPERHEVLNVYAWHDGAAAARVRDPEFVAQIRAAYAGEPEITFAEVLAVAEAT
jgi:hypothetical protein